MTRNSRCKSTIVTEV
uniref:Uncharacterized protein n=1 Tax=Rhizophora mucronata TaxID=61149 RepID=A0A2P2P4H1_RHIMU